MLPEIILIGAEWGGERTFNHVVVKCKPAQRKQVREIFEQTFIQRTKTEMRELLAKHGKDIELYCDFDGSYLAVKGETENLDNTGKGYWSFDTEDIAEYQVKITGVQEGVLIEYMPPVYTVDSGEKVVGTSNAVETALKKIQATIPEIGYYGYEGYYASADEGDKVSQRDWYSGNQKQMDKYTYVGNVLIDLWENDEFWEAIDTDFDEDNIEDVIAVIKLYEDFLGEEALETLAEHVDDEDLAELIRENM